MPAKNALYYTSTKLSLKIRARNNQVIMLRFYREPDPIEESQIHESLDIMKSISSVKAFLFSSSGFNTAAKRFAENRPVELLEKQKLEELLAKAGGK